MTRTGIFIRTYVLIVLTNHGMTFISKYRVSLVGISQTRPNLHYPLGLFQDTEISSPRVCLGYLPQWKIHCARTSLEEMYLHVRRVHP